MQAAAQNEQPPCPISTTRSLPGNPGAKMRTLVPAPAARACTGRLCPLSKSSVNNGSPRHPAPLLRECSRLPTYAATTRRGQSPVLDTDQVRLDLRIHLVGVAGLRLHLRQCGSAAVATILLPRCSPPSPPGQTQTAKNCQALCTMRTRAVPGQAAARPGSPPPSRGGQRGAMTEARGVHLGPVACRRGQRMTMVQVA